MSCNENENIRLKVGDFGLAQTVSTKINQTLQSNNF